MRSVRLLAVTAALAGCGLYAQSLHPGAIVFPDETDSRILDWGNNVVLDYLQIHNMSIPDQPMIRAYGRQDLYDNIKSLAWLKVMALIDSAGKGIPLSAQEQAVLTKFRDHSTYFRNDVLRRAVAEKNRFRSNLCTWKPDAELSQNLNFKYDGSYFCPKPVYVPANQFGEYQPAFPPKEYFLAFGQNESWLKPIVARPGGLRAVTHISHGGSLLLGAGIPAAMALGLALMAAFIILKGVQRVIFPQEGFHLMGAVGIGISLAFMITLIVLVVYLYTENERVLREQDTLDTDLRTAEAAPPFSDFQLNQLLKDTKQGYQLLYITFLDMTVPKMNSYSTQALPGPTALDPKFLVQVPGETTTTTMDEIEFTGWSREVYRARMSGGWFFQQGIGAGNLDPVSIGVRLQYRRNGVEYELSRHGRHFAIRKERPAKTDVECPVDPTTGVSSAPDITVCRTYVSTTAEIDLTNVGRRLISISQPIVFTSSMEARVSWSAPGTIMIEAKSVPTPKVSVTSPLPPGFTVAEGIPGQGRAYLSWDGRSDTPALGDYNFSLRAETPAGVATSTLKVNIVNKVRFTSPTTESGAFYAFPAGQTIDMVVAATGLPTSTPQLVSAVPNMCGLTVTPSDNTLLLKGVLEFPASGSSNICTLNFSVGSGENSDTLRLYFQVTEPPSQPQLVTTRCDVRVDFLYGECVIRTTGASGAVDISLSPGAVFPLGVGFADRHDGTAIVTLNSQIAVSNVQEIVVPLWIRVRSTAGNQASMVVHVDRTPFLAVNTPMLFTSAGAAGAYNGAVRSDTTLTLSGPLPRGIGFLQLGMDFYFLGTAVEPADLQLDMIATNAYGTTTVPIRIISATPPKFTSPSVINFYEGKASTFTVTTSGYPIRPLMGLERTGATLGLSDIDLAATGGLLPSGLKFLTKDPVSGETLYGRALITGTAELNPSRGNIFNHNMYIESLGGSDAQRITIKLVKQGDVSGDGSVNCADVTFITSRYGLRPGMPNYDYNADYNQDGVIDIRDLALVSAKLPAGSKCN